MEGLGQYQQIKEDNEQFQRIGFQRVNSVLIRRQSVTACQRNTPMKLTAINLHGRKQISHEQRVISLFQYTSS
jgi:hypothetical protein